MYYSFFLPRGRRIDSSQSKQKSYIIKGYWAANRISGRTEVRLGVPMVHPSHTAGLPQQRPHCCTARLKHCECVLKWTSRLKAEKLLAVLYSWNFVPAQSLAWCIWSLTPKLPAFAPTWFLPWKSSTHIMGNMPNVSKDKQNMPGAVNVHLANHLLPIYVVKYLFFCQWLNFSLFYYFSVCSSFIFWFRVINPFLYVWCFMWHLWNLSPCEFFFQKLKCCCSYFYCYSIWNWFSCLIGERDWNFSPSIQPSCPGNIYWMSLIFSLIYAVICLIYQYSLFT